MKNTIIITGGTILTILVVLSFAWAVTQVPQTQQVVTQSPKAEVSKPRPEDDRLSKEERNIFMEGCYDGTNKAYCTCVVDYLDATYTTEKIYEIAEEAEHDIPQEVIKASAACL